MRLLGSSHRVWPAGYGQQGECLHTALPEPHPRPPVAALQTKIIASALAPYAGELSSAIGRRARTLADEEDKLRTASFKTPEVDQLGAAGGGPSHCLTSPTPCVQQPLQQHLWHSEAQHPASMTIANEYHAQPASAHEPCSHQHEPGPCTPQAVSWPSGCGGVRRSRNAGSGSRRMLLLTRRLRAPLPS